MTFCTEVSGPNCPFHIYVNKSCLSRRRRRRAGEKNLSTLGIYGRINVRNKSLTRNYGWQEISPNATLPPPKKVWIGASVRERIDKVTAAHIWVKKGIFMNVFQPWFWYASMSWILTPGSGHIALGRRRCVSNEQSKIQWLFWWPWWWWGWGWGWSSGQMARLVGTPNIRVWIQLKPTIYCDKNFLKRTKLNEKEVG